MNQAPNTLSRLRSRRWWYGCKVRMSVAAFPAHHALRRFGFYVENLSRAFLLLRAPLKALSSPRTAPLRFMRVCAR